MPQQLWEQDQGTERNLEGHYQQEGSKTVTASETVNLSVQPSECMVMRYPEGRVIAGGGCLGVGA